MAPEREGFPRHARLTRSADLDRVRAEGTRMRINGLEFRFTPSPASTARVGVIVPRHGETAVRRNRVKRRIRELARREMLPALRSQDVVVRALPSAYAAPFAELQRAIRDAVRRVGGSS